MRKETLMRTALSLAASLVCGGAIAVETPGGATADRLIPGESGVGHMLVVPYYSTQGGNATLLSLINTDEVNGKAVKLRFRGALNADSVYDLQVFLAPGDMWTVNVSRNAAGVSFLTTEDNSCTKPTRTTINATPFSVARLSPHVSAPARAEQTREGYIEMITMADIPPATVGVFPLVKQSEGRLPACHSDPANAAWTALDTDRSTVADYAALGLTAPTTGITANWTIMNVPSALSWSGAAVALEAVNEAGTSGKGHLAYSPQTSQPALRASALSADPLFAGTSPFVTATMSDLPDLSTPYVATASSPAVQASAIAATWSGDSVFNEFWTEPSIYADTEWTLIAPTRRFAVGINYGAGTAASLIFNPDVSAHYISGNTTLKSDAACVAASDVKIRDRESNSPSSPGDVVIPGAPYQPPATCGAASVLTFNQAAQSPTAALGATVAVDDVDTGYTNGRLHYVTRKDERAGLPLIGSAFVRAYNPAVSAGVAGHFSVIWPHRYVQSPK
ncbi:hypothetical protein G7047_27570 [Diaphorobacter sp. HDW4A]|uniref:hypothetical protein n=1 Tax=Diaphorobacter sp. HDW4A TaxID=2714924 RepID=UPI00140E59D3|nr:hypothetical protein [Diaphorobacter sp. HDW4A]QIL83282.1 hypothetical protein G7047_27570 [Diaphorobacter sp. HDW4A]